MTSKDDKQPKGWTVVLSSIGASVIAGLIVAAIIGQWNPFAAIVAAAPAPQEAGESPASSPAATPTAPELEPSAVPPGEVPEPSSEPNADFQSEVSSPPLLDTSITQATIEWANTRDHVAPDTITSSYHAGFYPKVFTAQGELSSRDDCYVAWTLFSGDTAVSSGNSRCALSPGWSSSFWPKQAQLDVGAARVEALVTTGWGASETVVKYFNVSPG